MSFETHARCKVPVGYLDTDYACVLLCVSLGSSCHSYLVRDNVTGTWSDTNPFNPDYEHEGQPVPNPQSECGEFDVSH